MLWIKESLLWRYGPILKLVCLISFAMANARHVACVTVLTAICPGRQGLEGGVPLTFKISSFSICQRVYTAWGAVWYKFAPPVHVWMQQVLCTLLPTFINCPSWKCTLADFLRHPARNISETLWKESSSADSRRYFTCLAARTAASSHTQNEKVLDIAWGTLLRYRRRPWASAPPPNTQSSSSCILGARALYVPETLRR